jgi:lysozyme
MTTSEAGRALIRRHEGFRALPYLCPAGRPTIGYGHVIAPGERIDRVTEDEADRLLAVDLRRVEASLRDLVRVPVTQGQWDALASLAYNVGVGALGASTLLRKVNAGDVAGAAAEFGRWVHAGKRVLPGLVARRADERNLFDGRSTA